MSRRKVGYSTDARVDIFNILDWIAGNASVETAIRYVDRIDTFIQSLDLASERGVRRDDLIPGLRMISFRKRVMLAVAVDETSVTILRVFYGGQDWEKALQSEESLPREP